MSTMTVGALVDLLSQLPRDYTVTTEGCDCIGEVFSIAVDGTDVLLQRVSKDSGNVTHFAEGDWVGRPSPSGLEPYE